jgi:hypothetical protein
VDAATAGLIVLSVVDTANGATTLLAEVPHLITVVGLVLMHLVSERSQTPYRRWLLPLKIVWSRSAAARSSRSCERCGAVHGGDAA